MELGAVTHFAQGWSTDLLNDAAEIGVSDIRDTILWEEIETIKNEYDFSSGRIAYLDLLDYYDIDITLLFARNNPLYDSGGTPYTDEGRAAFADFVAATLEQFPYVDRIEIGNEFNAQNFVSGVVKTAPYAQRAHYYTEILKAVHDRLEDDFPDVEILGGAVHSVAVGYLKQTFNAGALAYSDGIAFHPYTTPPEQLASHLEMLRDAMGEDAQPLYATEFSQNFSLPGEAPAYLVKMTAVLAAADVAAAHWYALREQPWYDTAALLSKNGAVRPAGEAYEFLQESVLAAGPAQRLASDSSTFLYGFGDSALVAWGADRSIDLGADVAWFDARGSALSDGIHNLDPDEPIIAIALNGTSLSTPVLGAQLLVADSYFDFTVTDPQGEGESPWSYFKQSGTGMIAPLSTMQGGDRQNEGWRPYIGDNWSRPLAVSETEVRPVDFGNGTIPGKRYAILERFTAEDSFFADIRGYWAVSAASTDGIEISVLLNGVELFSASDTDPVLLLLESLWLEAGDTLDFVVDTEASSIGDSTYRRISILTAT